MKSAISGRICPVCNKPIVINDDITWNRRNPDANIYHVACYPPATKN